MGCGVGRYVWGQLGVYGEGGCVYAGRGVGRGATCGTLQ